MSDFFQTGAIATLHRLGQSNVRQLEQKLQEFSLETPVALVLPCHVKELGTQALKLIVRELKNVTYLKQIVVASTARLARVITAKPAPSSASCRNADAPLERRPAHATAIQETGRRGTRRGPGARGGTCGRVLAMCWPVNRCGWCRA